MSQDQGAASVLLDSHGLDGQAPHTPLSKDTWRTPADSSPFPRLAFHCRDWGWENESIKNKSHLFEHKVLNLLHFWHFKSKINIINVSFIDQLILILVVLCFRNWFLLYQMLTDIYIIWLKALKITKLHCFYLWLDTFNTLFSGTYYLDS